jgi:hypothetical protein
MISVITENIINYILYRLYPDQYEIKTIKKISSTESFIIYESDDDI